MNFALKYWENYLFAILLSSPLLTILVIAESIVNGSIDGKILVFNMVASFVLFTAWIYLTIRNNKQISVNIIDLSLLILLVFLTCNYFSKYHYFNDLWAGVTLSTLLYFTIKVSTQHAFFRQNMRVLMGISFLTISILECSIALLQLFGYSKSLHPMFKITGTFHNPGILGIFLSISFTFSLAVILFFVSTGNIDMLCKQLARVNLIPILLLLPSTDSRDAILCCLCILSILLIYKNERLRSFIKQNKASFVICCTILFCFIVVLAVRYKPHSALGRLVIWKSSMQMLRKDVLTGIGYNQYKNFQLKYQAEYFSSVRSPQDILLADKVDYAFNDLLQFVIENGIIGLILILIFLGLVAKYTIGNVSQLDGLGKAAMVSVLCLALSSLVSYPFQLIPFIFIFFFFLSIANINAPTVFTIYKIKIWCPIGFCFMGLGTALLFFFQLNEYDIRKQLYIADTYLANNEPGKAKIIYTGAYEKLEHEKYILLGLGKSLFLSGNIDSSLTIYKEAARYITDPFLYIGTAECYREKNNFSESEYYLKKASQMIPNKMYPKYLLVQLYVQKGDRLSALSLAQEILSMPVKINSPAVIQIRTEMNQLITNKNL